MKIINRISNISKAVDPLVFLMAIFCITPSISASDNSKQFRMSEAIAGCTFEAWASDPQCSTQCCWQVTNYACDGSLIGTYQTGCAECSEGAEGSCSSSCAELSRQIAENWPIYSNAQCEPQECYKEEELPEGTCPLAGMPKCPIDEVSNPVKILTGENKEEEIDIEFNTPHAKGFKFYRTYKSRSEVYTSLGHNWSHNYNVTMDT